MRLRRSAATTAATVLVSLLATCSLSGQVAEGSAWVSVGVGYGHAVEFSSTDVSASVAGSYVANAGLFTMRWVEVRPMLSSRSVADLGVLYGRASSAGRLRTSGAVGIAYVYDQWGGRGVGLPLEASLGIDASDIGVEMTLLADLNGLSSFWGAQLRVVLGRLRQQPAT